MISAQNMGKKVDRRRQSMKGISKEKDELKKKKTFSPVKRN